MLITHGPLTGDQTNKWNQYKQMVTESAKTVLGPKSRIHQDWFDENDVEIGKLLEKKPKAFLDWQNDINSSAKHDRFKHLHNKAQREIRNMQNRWWDLKADEVQQY